VGTTANENSIQKSASEPRESEGEVEDVVGWGSSKRDYYNADVIETEADAMEEEAEAKRLQQKKLQKMSEADFGFDENEWLDEGNEGNEDEVVTELLIEEITADISIEDRLRLLQTRYPEFNLLAEEYLQLQPLYEGLQVESKAIQPSKHSVQMRAPLAIVKCRALAAYIGALAMYFAILTSTAKTGDGSAALDPAEIREHSVMDSLLQCREMWSKVKNLKAPDKLSTEAEGEEIALEVSVSSVDGGQEASITTQEMPANKSKKEEAREAAKGSASKSRTARIRAAEAELVDLSSLIPKLKKSTKPVASVPAAPADDSDSDFGEEVALDTRTAAEKAAKKRSLRFYTSQITQKANRRAGAGRDAGGDADLPYRERLRDRQARLNAEAEKRGKKLDSYGRGKSHGMNLGDGSSGDDEKDVAAADAVRGEADEYYELVANASQSRKADKAARYAAIAAAKATGAIMRVVEGGEIAEGGKRAIGYVIEKNKGLTPRRTKDVRNPRVKKRKKYEEKMKKLASMKPVYKGGEERGGYGGEKTGIKTGLVKSIKL
jgi:U3 small nucleolar RNA-associated protein 3